MSHKHHPFATVILGIVLLLTLGTGLVHSQDGDMDTTTLEANKALVHAFNDTCNAQDFDALDTLLTEDFVRHSSATPGVMVTSREAMKAFQAANVVTFPDQDITIEMMVAEGDLVAVYAMLRGTMEGPMGDIPPTGGKIEAPFLGIFRIEDGLIAELWVEWDNIYFLSQLGLFPPPGDAASGE